MIAEAAELQQPQCSTTTTNSTPRLLPGCGNSSPRNSSPTASSTNDPSLKSNPMNSPHTSSVTSSAGLPAGRSPCNSPGGIQLDLFGPEAVPANRSAPQASSSPKPTSDTSGPPSLISSRSAALSELLGSKLQARLAKVGSMEYRQTWSRKVTPAGRPYWAHTASAPRTSARDFTGWPTPQEDNANNAYGHKGTSYSDLPTAAQWAGWTTPQAHDSSPRGGGQTYENNGAGNACLARDAALAGWASPASRDHKDTPGMATTGINPDGSIRNRIDMLPRQAAQCPQPWAIPRAEDSESCGMRHSRGVADTLSAQAGQDLQSSTAGTEKPAALNPNHSRWLMGFPAAWGSCGATAMQSSRKQPRPSSKPTRKCVKK